MRRPDGLETWSMVPCDGPARTIAEVRWVSIENTPEDWTGVADYAMWSLDEVENGCANDSTATILVKDVPNTREPLLDENGEQRRLYGRLAWIYQVPVQLEKPDGRWYFGVRNVVRDGDTLSSILSVECLPEGEPLYFQSDFFGFPCAITFSEVFGHSYCLAVELRGSSTNCDAIRRLRVRCGNGKLRVRVRSTLPEGTELTIDNDGDFRTMVIDERGRGKVKWRRQTGPHTVCILECPDMCETADCGA